ncbi:MAG: hypothetical protein PHO31_02300 [Candidatus Pacebacteria bacterium]|nr:hypothetical protein [Candidatus Paceibacterota bacterium]
MDRKCFKKVILFFFGFLFLVSIQLQADNSCYFLFWGRRAGGSEYPIWKEFYKYEDPSQDTCYRGMPWCTKTQHNNVKLKHYHFTENFTSTEKEDMNRYAEYHWGDDFDSKFSDADSTYNCHSWALGPNQTVWNVNQDTTLSNDFVEVSGTCGDPYKVGQYCKHLDDHSSRITELFFSTGSPGSAVKKIRSKWGGYGIYDGCSNPSAYGNVVKIYKRK